MVPQFGERTVRVGVDLDSPIEQVHGYVHFYSNWGLIKVPVVFDRPDVVKTGVNRTTLNRIWKQFDHMQIKAAYLDVAVGPQIHTYKRGNHRVILTQDNPHYSHANANRRVSIAAIADNYITHYDDIIARLRELDPSLFE